MRTIKFRGRKPNGEWLYGDLVHRDGQVAIIPADGYDSIDCYFVDPETVGQYTGTDDKNNVNIWEGDILEWSTFTSEDEYLSQLKEVKCEQGEFRLMNPKGDYPAYDHFSDVFESREYYESVGNIHDRPELLEGVTP